MPIIRFDWNKAKKMIREIEEARMIIACEIVESEAKYLCPVDEGNLIKQFSSEVESSGNEIIGRIMNGAEYAAFVEFPTAPHIIEPRNKDRLKFKIDGEWITTKKVHHPGTQGIPFLRGALISKKREVMEILELQ